jgi:hypothetical protein
MRTGIHIRPRIDLEYVSILLWENTVGGARALARGAASYALRRPAANSPTSERLLSHKGVEQRRCSTRAGRQTVSPVDVQSMNAWIDSLRFSVITRRAR